jgi:hypothetical protein
MSEENRNAGVSLPLSKNAERKLIQEVPLVMLISEKEVKTFMLKSPNPRVRAVAQAPDTSQGQPDAFRWFSNNKFSEKSG